mgnify:CR=1 FL=1
MLLLLAELTGFPGPLNLFRYITFRAGAAFFTALVFGFITAWILTRTNVPFARTLEQLMAKAKADADVAELPVVVKADVQGSAEAIVQALEKIGNAEVRVRVLHYGVGAITDSDVGQIGRAHV